MKAKISVVITTANDEKIIEKALLKLYWVDEIIAVISNNSHDNTEKICKKYDTKVFISKNHLGYQRRLGIIKSSNKWILLLDSDEIITEKLKTEISKSINTSKYVAYKIPYQNYFLKSKINYGNQKYEKIRLFLKKCAHISYYKIHPNIIIEGSVGRLNNSIEHHSFRSITQVLKKFTYYASVEASLLYKKGERVTLKKLTLYPAHMFYSIFIKDKGYRDGIWGFGLASCFTYMEFMKYFFLLTIQINRLFHLK